MHVPIYVIVVVAVCLIACKVHIRQLEKQLKDANKELERFRQDELDNLLS